MDDRNAGPGAVRGGFWCPAGPPAATPVGEVEDSPSGAGARPEAQPGTPRLGGAARPIPDRRQPDGAAPGAERRNSASRAATPWLGCCDEGSRHPEDNDLADVPQSGLPIFPAWRPSRRQCATTMQEACCSSPTATPSQGGPGFPHSSVTVRQGFTSPAGLTRQERTAPNRSDSPPPSQLHLGPGDPERRARTRRAEPVADRLGPDQPGVRSTSAGDPRGGLGDSQSCHRERRGRKKGTAGQPVNACIDDHATPRQPARCPPGR